MSRRDLVIFSLLLVCAAMVFLFGPGEGVERVELREEQGFPLDSGVLVGSGVESVEGVESVGSYDLGYREGYLAFLRQQGIESSLGEASVIYASSHGVFVGEDDGGMEGRGYMDGYHKASESLSCPTVCPY